jgi:DNA-binding LacI/PurR family transcriptional regulator
LASFLTPTLTTVRMPLRQLGGHAVDLLITSGPHEPVTEVVGSPIDLIERESTTTPTRKTQLQGHDA